MKKIVDGETDLPEAEQVAYLDGYSLAERTLEGVMFVIRSDNGELVCDGVRPEDQEYYEDFSEKRRAEWQKEAVKEFHWDSYSNEDGTRELFVLDVEEA